MTPEDRKRAVDQAAWARHNMWCQSKEHEPGERIGNVRDNFTCTGPKRGDKSIAEAIVAALFD